MLEILENRYGASSTIVTSQLPTKNWHEILADPTIADTSCDRLVHNANVIALNGPSGRERKDSKSSRLNPQREPPLVAPLRNLTARHTKRGGLLQARVESDSRRNNAGGRVARKAGKPNLRAGGSEWGCGPKRR